MREIKFRGLRDTQDGGTEWVYGDLTTDNSGCLYKDTHPDRIHWRVGNAYHNAPIRKGTRGQFTGLLDSKGKEIWEGDVMRWHGEDDEAQAFEVVIDRGAVRKKWKDWDESMPYPLLDAFDLKSNIVIGNKFQHPDLLP